jgi:hypothetical protein
VASEPDWKAALRTDLDHHLGSESWADDMEAVLLPHIEAAYRRGLMAGRSQANYPTRRKKREGD